MKDMNFELYRQQLTMLEQERKGILGYILLSRLTLLAAMVLFFSLFFGFIKLFGNNASDDVFGYFFWFFYAVAGFILTVFIYNAVSVLFKMAGTKHFQNKKLIGLISLSISILAIIAAGILGRLWLGPEFNAAMMIKWVSSIAGFIALAVISNWFMRFEKKFLEKFKLTMIPLFVKHLTQKVEYSPNGFIEKKVFVDSGLYPAQTITSYTGGNLFRGSYGKGKYTFSELKVVAKEEKRSKGKSETRIYDLFDGLFYVADFNKNFSGRTLILPDRARKHFGEFLGEKLNALPAFSETKIVRLENIDFEKEFAVYSTDQIEARYIITPAFMERLFRLQQRIGQEIYVSFVNNRMYIAISSSIGLLSPLVFKPIDTPEQIEPIINLISGLIDTGNELDLNTRIWGNL